MVSSEDVQIFTENMVSIPLAVQKHKSAQLTLILKISLEQHRTHGNLDQKTAYYLNLSAVKTLHT